MSDRRYRLTVNARQAAVMREALELYSRLKHGQVEHIRDLFFDRVCTGDFTHNAFEAVAGQMKAMIFPELRPNAFYGVGSKTYPEADVAWDTMQTIRHRLAWDRLHDAGKTEPAFCTVDYDPPMGYSGEPLPKIEAVDE